jgi:replicative DNA helicase
MAASQTTDADLEKNVLGQLLAFGELVPDFMKAGLRLEHFARHHHRLTYQAILEVANKGCKPDLTLVGSQLRANGSMDEVGMSIKHRAELDTTISRLVDAIAAGGECAALIARIKTCERERAELDGDLSVLEAHAEQVVTIETVRKAMDRLLVEWRNALLDAPTNVALARQVVQKLVDGHIEFEPRRSDRCASGRFQSRRRKCQNMARKCR